MAGEMNYFIMVPLMK